MGDIYASHQDERTIDEIRAEEALLRERLETTNGIIRETSAELGELRKRYDALKEKSDAHWFIRFVPDEELPRVLAQAIADPGHFLPRGDNYKEPITAWGARAVMVVLAHRLSKYAELLLSVENKVEGETRHQTAARIIRAAYKQSDELQSKSAV